VCVWKSYLTCRVALTRLRVTLCELPTYAALNCAGSRPQEGATLRSANKETHSAKLEELEHAWGHWRLPRLVPEQVGLQHMHARGASRRRTTTSTSDEPVPSFWVDRLTPSPSSAHCSTTRWKLILSVLSPMVLQTKLCPAAFQPEILSHSSFRQWWKLGEKSTGQPGHYVCVINRLSNFSDQDPRDDSHQTAERAAFLEKNTPVDRPVVFLHRKTGNNAPSVVCRIAILCCAICWKHARTYAPIGGPPDESGVRMMNHAGLAFAALTAARPPVGRRRRRQRKALQQGHRRSFHLVMLQHTSLSPNAKLFQSLLVTIESQLTHAKLF